MELHTFNANGMENFSGRLRGARNPETNNSAGVYYEYKKDNGNGILHVIYSSVAVDGTPATSIDDYSYEGDLMDIQRGSKDIGELMELLYAQLAAILEKGDAVTQEYVMSLCGDYAPEWSLQTSANTTALLDNLALGKPLGECCGNILSHVYRNPNSELYSKPRGQR